MLTGSSPPVAGGGDARKESVRRPQVRAHVETIGERLRWHGALSVDYILASADAVPRYVDCNPRLVEPMSAYLAGTDLVQLLLQVSLGETPTGAPDSRAGVRTHLAMQACWDAHCAAARGATFCASASNWRNAEGFTPTASRN